MGPPFTATALAVQAAGAAMAASPAEAKAKRDDAAPLVDALFGSPRFQAEADQELRNIFRKVGVSSRVELARAVEQADRAAHEPA